MYVHNVRVCEKVRDKGTRLARRMNEKGSPMFDTWIPVQLDRLRSFTR